MGMKKIIVTCITCLLVLSASAQGRLGIQAGATFTDLKLSDASMDKDMFDSKTGFLAGITYDLKLVGPLSLNTGLFYVQRSVKEDGSATGDPSSTDRFSSIELPANLKFTFPLPVVNPFVIAGPYLDCGVSAKAGGKKLDYGDDLNRFNYGLAFGAGVDLFKRIRVMYQYDLGLSDMTTSVADAIKTKPRGSRISAAILF